MKMIMNSKMKRAGIEKMLAAVLVGMLGFSGIAGAQDAPPVVVEAENAAEVAAVEMRATAVSALTEGEIERVLARAGDEVARGELIAVVDSAEYQILLRMARAKLDMVKADIDSATASLEMAMAHREEMKKRGDAVAEEVRRADFMVLSAEAERRKKEAELAIAESEAMLMELYLERTRVIAPHDGVLESVEVQMGELVSKGSVLFTLRRVE